MPEKTTRWHIDKILEAHRPNVDWHCPVPGVYGLAHLDYIGFAYGYGFVIEAKKPGKKPTDRQNDRMRQAQLAGAAIFVITGLQVEYERLSAWLERCRQLPAPDFRPPVDLPQPKMLATPT